MPLWAEKRLKKFFTEFLREWKPPRTAYDMLIGVVEKGGLGLIDVAQRKQCLRVKLVKKFLDEKKCILCGKKQCCIFFKQVWGF